MTSKRERIRAWAIRADTLAKITARLKPEPWNDYAPFSVRHGLRKPTAAEARTLAAITLRLKQPRPDPLAAFDKSAAKIFATDIARHMSIAGLRQAKDFGVIQTEIVST